MARDGTGNVAEELARVRDPRVGGQRGLGVHHRLERVERILVAAQLQLGITDHAVDVRVVRIDLTGTGAQAQGSGEVMTGGGQCRHADQGSLVVLRLQIERAAERSLCFGVEAGVGGDPGLLHVGQAQRGERDRIVRRRGQVLLETGDRRIETAAHPRGGCEEIIGLDGSGTSTVRRGDVGLGTQRSEHPGAGDDQQRHGEQTDHGDPCDSVPSCLLLPASVVPGGGGKVRPRETRGRTNPGVRLG